MALSELTKNIRRLHLVNAEKKKLEKEEDSLKAFFRTQAGDVDMIFTDDAKGIEVPVTWKERTGWDTDALAKKLGTAADECRKTSRYAEVSCRKKA